MPGLKIAPQMGDASLAQQWLELARQDGGNDAYSGKRESVRYTWDAPLEIHVALPRGRSEVHYATAKDISCGGIGLQCRQPIPLYSPIQICLAGELVGVPAVVTHCTPTLAGHLIGTRFRFEPKAKAAARDVKVG